MVISSCKKKKKKKKMNKKGIKIDPSLERKFLGISISLFLLIQIFPRDSKNPFFLPSFLPSSSQLGLRFTNATLRPVATFSMEEG